MEQIDTLKAKVAWLKSLLVRREEKVPAEWGLTKSETRIAGALMANKITTNGQLIEAVYWDCDEPEASVNDIQVLVYKLRRKLKPIGIEIKVRRGIGYCLEPHPN